MERTACISKVSVLPSKSANSPCRIRRKIIKKGNKYIYKIVFFVIGYVANINVTASISLFPCASNMIISFTELGRLCGHEPRRHNVRDVRF
jgi:hypothetical protein